MNKSILIVATGYAPSSSVGGRRIERLAKGLLARSWRVTVLTCSDRMFASVDDSIPIPPGIRTIRVEPSIKRAFEKDNIGEGKDRPSRRVIPRLLRIGIRTFLTDRFSPWVKPAIKAGSTVDFDFVLASGPSFCTFQVAQKLSQLKNAHLLLDYRDPWILARVKNPNYSQRRLAQTEQECLTRAKAVFTTSKTISKNLAEFLQAKPITLYTGVDKDENVYANPIESSGPYLVYLGSLAYKRSIVDVLKALVQLEKENKIRVSLYYAGPHENFALDQARLAKATSHLISLGKIGRTQSLGILRHAAASVIVGSTGYEYALPGKIFEAVSLRKTILLSAGSDFAAYKFVEEHDLGFVCSSQEDLYKALVQLMQSRRASSEIPAILSTETMLDNFESMLLS